MTAERLRQRARRRRAMARKVGALADGMLALQSPWAHVAAMAERSLARMAYRFDAAYIAKQHAEHDAAIAAQGEWLTRRLRYRNRKGYSTARRFGVPRGVVGEGRAFERHADIVCRNLCPRCEQGLGACQCVGSQWAVQP